MPDSTAELATIDQDLRETLRRLERAERQGSYELAVVYAEEFDALLARRFTVQQTGGDG